MVRGGERPVGPADLASAQRQALQRLRRGHSVNQMKVYINECRLANFLADHMSIPNLVEQGLRRHARLLQANFSLSELADRPFKVKAPRPDYEAGPSSDSALIINSQRPAST